MVRIAEDHLQRRSDHFLQPRMQVSDERPDLFRGPTVFVTAGSGGLIGRTFLIFHPPATEIPTLSEWGMLGMGLLLTGLGLRALRRPPPRCCVALRPAPAPPEEAATRFIARTGDNIGNDCLNSAFPCKTITHPLSPADPALAVDGCNPTRYTLVL
jgi:hypothetical protein